MADSSGGRNRVVRTDRRSIFRRCRKMFNGIQNSSTRAHPGKNGYGCPRTQRYPGEMGNTADRRQQRDYVRIWEANGPLLQQIRDREIRRADTANAIRMFGQAFRIGVRELPPRESSGLVEWQDYMSRWRGRG
jgi:hypothetical protein